MTTKIHIIFIFIIRFTILLFLSPENNLANAQKEITLSPPPPPPPPPTNYFHRKLNPSITIAIVVIICALFLTVLFTILRHCGELNDDDDDAATAAAPSQPFSHQGLEPSLIETFPIFVYAAVRDLKIGKQDLECAICLSEFKEDDVMRFLPKCNHVFHPFCIDKWLSSHVTCPVCRANLSPEPPKTGDDNSDEVMSSPSESLRSETQTQIAIDVVREERGETRELDALNCSPAAMVVIGKLPRSHSTGHSLVQLRENTERYTLRLSEEVRRQLMTWGKLKRTRSYDVVLVKGGYRSGGEGSSSGKIRVERGAAKWVFTMTPPFVYRGSSVTVKSPRRGDGDGSSNGKCYAYI